jgi:hypothetical protein
LFLIEQEIVCQHQGKDRDQFATHGKTGQHAFFDCMATDSSREEEEVGDTEQGPRGTRTQELDRIRAKLATIRNNKSNRFNNSSITKNGSDAESYKKEKMDLGTTASATAKRVLRFERHPSRTQDDGESGSLPSV